MIYDWEKFKIENLINDKIKNIFNKEMYNNVNFRVTSKTKNLIIYDEWNFENIHILKSIISDYELLLKELELEKNKIIRCHCLDCLEYERHMNILLNNKELKEMK